MKSLFFILPLCLFLISCSNELILEEAPFDNVIRENKNFTIILPEDHTTGYTWTINDNYNKKNVEFINSVWHGNNKGVYYHFSTLKSGLCTLNFVCRKFTDTSDFKTFTLKIRP